MKLKLALFLLLPTLALADDLKTGENLITEFGPEFSDYGNYQPFSMREHNTDFKLWKSQEIGFSDHYAINIAPIKVSDLIKFKDIQDEPSHRTCTSYQSDIANQDTINGYQTITWQTSCNLEDKTVTTVQMAILGNNHFYHLRKLWKVPVTDIKVAEWQALFAKTTLCDTTNDKHACPSK